MSEEREDVLLRVAGDVSDGTPVNWDREKGVQPGLRETLEQLSIMEKIRNVHQPSLDATASARGETSPVKHPPAPISTWGPLRIFAKAGEGGFGEVYRAYDPTLESEVALKLLKAADPLDRTSADRFLSEARRLARVRHPNVITVHGADVHDGRLGIWLDFVRGKTLEALLHEHGPYGAHEAALIGIDICRALAALHAAGLVHCDVKTNNVMREEGGRILLMDFGSAGRSAGAESGGDEIRGTPITMAPEQMNGTIAGPRTDIYGLGVLLYRLVTGRHPIEGTSFAEIREKHERRASVGLRDRRADLPSAFIEVVHKALAPEPQERFATAGEMERALQATLGAAPTPIDRPRWYERLRIEVRVLIAASVLALAIGGPYWLWGRVHVAVPPPTPTGQTPVGTPIPAPAEKIPLTATAMLHRLTRQGTDEALYPGARVSPGDRLYMEIQGSDSMSVYILNEDERGRAYVLFPLPGVGPSNPLPPGVRYRLPGQAGAGPLYWDVTSPGRRETVIAIASRNPLLRLEKEIARFQRAQPGRPVTYHDVGPEALHSLRGIGGLSTDRNVQEGGEKKPLSQALSAIGTRGARNDDVWVWQIQLENPEPRH